MDQIDKKKIMSSSYVKINFQLITSFLMELHLSRLWDFVMQILLQCHFTPLEIVIVVGWKLIREYQGVCKCVE